VERGAGVHDDEVTVTFQERREAFGEKLRALRARSGMNGRDFAAALGAGQPKISKLETGRQTATDDDVRAWAAVVGLSEEETAALLAELAELRVEQAGWRRQLRSGHRARQNEIGSLERTAARIRAVDVMAVPGLVQTPAYARAIFATQAELYDVERDLDEAVLARMQRQQLLYEPGRDIEILIAEAALRHPVCTPAELAAQLDRLIAVIGLPGVRLGVLPSGRRLPFVLAHGFAIVGDQVLVDTMTSELRIVDPDQVAAYNRITDRLWPVAVEGDDARALLARLASGPP
jgi:transcriptional regulator with XRE-family HTH domain